MNADLFRGFIAYEYERVNKSRIDTITELETVSCEIHKVNLEKRLANLTGQLSMLRRCERVVGELLEEDAPKVKLIHNPVTGKCYEIRQHSSKAGRRGIIKGLWSKDKT